MRAKLIVEGKEFSIEIQDPELEKLLKPKKKTGYERVEKNVEYFYTCGDASIESMKDYRDSSSNDDYNAANYYSDRTVAENNVRADKLMRQLRRFAVEHRKEDLRWGDTKQLKHYIVFDCGMALGVHHCTLTREPNVVYFDSTTVAVDAINTFNDELIWYFTEYKDSL